MYAAASFRFATALLLSIASLAQGQFTVWISGLVMKSRAAG